LASSVITASGRPCQLSRVAREQRRHAGVRLVEVDAARDQLAQRAQVALQAAQHRQVALVALAGGRQRVRVRAGGERGQRGIDAAAAQRGVQRLVAVLRRARTARRRFAPGAGVRGARFGAAASAATRCTPRAPAATPAGRPAAAAARRRAAAGRPGEREAEPSSEADQRASSRPQALGAGRRARRSRPAGKTCALRAALAKAGHSATARSAGSRRSR
jgi:hypothetical protein